jgi:hypothetical protein
MFSPCKDPLTRVTAFGQCALRRLRSKARKFDDRLHYDFARFWIEAGTSRRPTGRPEDDSSAIMRCGPRGRSSFGYPTMRQVAVDFLESTLRRGGTLEQFIGGANQDHESLIRWIELVPAKAGIEVWDFSVPYLGEQCLDHCPLVDVELEPVAIVADPMQALLFAQSELGAKPTRWVSQGLSPDAFLLLLAGRSS